MMYMCSCVYTYTIDITITHTYPNFLYKVYKATLPSKGEVAVKVQRPGVRKLVERDTELLLTVAKFLESIPALPGSNNHSTASSSSATKNTSTRLINTQLVSATQEFMSR